MKIIAIESTCDDTSICLLQDDKIIYTKTISSINEQQKYGGVVPEIASRAHLNNIHLILDDLIKTTNIDIYTIDYIAYSDYPGLPGSLHISVVFAKTLAKLINAQLIPINHLAGHLFSAFINNINSISFPMLGLVVSGGNTIIYKIDSVVEYTILNITADDAIGDVYDKVARSLDLSYPGGPKIDQIYDESKATINFIKKKLLPSAQFSFSGFKTAVLSYINTLKMKNMYVDTIAIASSFQKNVIDYVIDKLQYYLDLYKIDSIALGGGVSANQLLRRRIKEIAKHVYIPELKYTGDNSAMIGFYTYLLLKYNQK